MFIKAFLNAEKYKVIYKHGYNFINVFEYHVNKIIKYI